MLTNAIKRPAFKGIASEVYLFVRLPIIQGDEGIFSMKRSNLRQQFHFARWQKPKKHKVQVYLSVMASFAFETLAFLFLTQSYGCTENI